MTEFVVSRGFSVRVAAPLSGKSGLCWPAGLVFLTAAAAHFTTVCRHVWRENIYGLFSLFFSLFYVLAAADNLYSGGKYSTLRRLEWVVFFSCLFSLVGICRIPSDGAKSSKNICHWHLKGQSRKKPNHFPFLLMALPNSTDILDRPVSGLRADPRVRSTQRFSHIHILFKINLFSKLPAISRTRFRCWRRFSLVPVACKLTRRGARDGRVYMPQHTSWEKKKSMWHSIKDNTGAADTGTICFIIPGLFWVFNQEEEDLY